MKIMELLAKLDKDSILAEKIFQEIFEQEDEIYKARMILSLTDRAAELGVKKKFEELLKAYKRVDREMKQNGRTFSDLMTICFAVHGLPVKMAYMHRMTARWMRSPVIIPFFR